jgi:hypothetical protein
MKKIKYDHNWHMNGLRISASWNHHESIDICAKKMSNFLNDFIKIYPDWVPFKTFFSTRRKIVYSDVPSIKELCKNIEEGMKTNYVDFYNSSYYLNVLKESDQKKLVEIELKCATSNTDSSFISMKFPPYNDEARNIVTKKFFIDSLELIRRNWNPYSGLIGLPFLMIKDYARVGDDWAGNIPESGWITFYSDKLGELPPLPDWAIITKIDGYTYIQVTEELPVQLNEKKLHEVIIKVYEISSIIKPWFKSKWNLIVDSEL